MRLKQLRPYIPLALFFMLGTAFALLCMLVGLSALAPRLTDIAPILEHSDRVIAAVLAVHLFVYIFGKISE